jgi:hypothetical protein
MDWWSTQGAVFMRIWATFALAFGVFLAYAVVPKGKRAKRTLSRSKP